MSRLLDLVKRLWGRSMMHRAMLVTPPVALILWTGYVSVGARSAAQYFTAKVEHGDISQVVQATGTINPVNIVPVGSVVSGNVVSLSVDFNSQVKKGDILAQIDPVPFQTGLAHLLSRTSALENLELPTVYAGVSPEERTRRAMRIGYLPFRVDGVLESNGQNVTGQDQDAIIFAPYTTVQRKISGITWPQFIVASAVSQEASVAAVAPITSLLRERHRIRSGDDDDFLIRTQADIADLANQTQSVMTMLLGGIASVSLVVGGIGIMNIMLVPVTERTRGIGVRMAVGATEDEVRRQFLVEAVTLSMMGGAIGIIFGLVGSALISNFLSWPTLISGKAIIAAVIFSTAVGIFFGYYPAHKAAQLDPIEALRYE